MEVEKSKLSIFDWLKQVTYIKDPWTSFNDEDKTTFNPYMLHRFISMYEPYIDLANYIQQYWQLTPEQIYKIYCSYLPKQKIYAPYIKSSKPKQDKELLLILANHYKVSTREVSQYLNILNKEDVREILKDRGTSDDDVSRLLNEEKKKVTNEKTTKKGKTPTRGKRKSNKLG